MLFKPKDAHLFFDNQKGWGGGGESRVTHLLGRDHKGTPH